MSRVNVIIYYIYLHYPLRNKMKRKGVCCIIAMYLVYFLFLLSFGEANFHTRISDGVAILISLP